MARSGDAVMETGDIVRALSASFFVLKNSSCLDDATAIIAMSADGKISHISTISIRLRFIDFCDLMSAPEVWRRLVELKFDLPSASAVDTHSRRRREKSGKENYAAQTLRQGGEYHQCPYSLISAALPLRFNPACKNGCRDVLNVSCPSLSVRQSQHWPA